MIEMNKVISNNIIDQLKKQKKKQTDLAAALGVPKQTISKMLAGARNISAPELYCISSFLKISMEELTTIPNAPQEMNVVRAFMGYVDTDAAKDALAAADELADLIIFHARVKENTIDMMQVWRP